MLTEGAEGLRRRGCRRGPGQLHRGACRWPRGGPAGGGEAAPTWQGHHSVWPTWASPGSSTRAPGQCQTEGPPVRQRGGQSSNDTWKLRRSLDSWLHSPAPGPEETRRPRDAAPAPGACLLLVPASACLLASRRGGGGRYQQHRLTQRESARALATLYQDSKATVPRARQATRCCGRRGGSQPSVPHCPDPLLPAAARPSLGPRQR